jgi:hypothetical protein
LQKHGGGGAVHQEPPFSRGYAALPKPTCRFDGGEPFVHQLDLPTGRVGQRLGKATRPFGLVPLAPLAIERQPDQKTVHLFLILQADQLGQELFAVMTWQRRTGMGYGSEFVGYSQSHTHLP